MYGYNWTGGMAKLPAVRTLIDQHAETISRLTDGVLQPAPAVVLINLGANGVISPFSSPKTFWKKFCIFPARKQPHA